MSTVLRLGWIKKSLFGGFTVPAPNSGYLSLVSSTALQFLPYAGDGIRVNGGVQQIPAGGLPGLGNTGIFINGVGGQNLAASTNYYIYCFSNNGVLTADYSTTGHQTDLTDPGVIGTEVKAGDGTRTLIGFAATNGSAQFVDTGQNRQVLSWFNRRPKNIGIGLSNSTSANTNATYQQIGGGISGTFCQWSDTLVQLAMNGQAMTSVNGAFGSVGVGLDSTTTVLFNQFIFGFGNANALYTYSYFYAAGAFSEGVHTLTLNGYGSGTVTASTINVVNSNIFGVLWG